MHSNGGINFETAENMTISKIKFLIQEILEIQKETQGN
jgi:hypothetical protein